MEIRVIVRAAKASGGPELSYPAIALNDEQGQPTEAAEAVLRGGKTLRIAEP